MHLRSTGIAVLQPLVATVFLLKVCPRGAALLHCACSRVWVGGQPLPKKSSPCGNSISMKGPMETCKAWNRIGISKLSLAKASHMTKANVQEPRGRKLNFAFGVRYSKKLYSKGHRYSSQGGGIVKDELDNSTYHRRICIYLQRQSA